LSKELFVSRLRGDQTMMMTKSIKIVEEYMKRVGSKPALWDDQFMQFLRINDPRIMNKLIPGSLGTQVIEEEVKGDDSPVGLNDLESSTKEFIAKLYQPITVIDNYQSSQFSLNLEPSPRQVIQMNNAFITISH
jgi:hypothetical protein